MYPKADLGFHDVVLAHEWTCYYCPAQVEGVLKDGRCFYFRYRWGVAALGVGDSLGEANRDPNRVSLDYGDAFGGVLSQDEFVGLFMRLLRRRLV